MLDGKRTLTEAAIRIAKAEVNSAATRRLNAFAAAQKMLPAVQQARQALIPEGKQDSDAAMARWLNTNGHTLHKGHSWSRQTVRQSIMTADEKFIKYAVSECRALMSARALSADFEAKEVGELEAHYIHIIADALALGHDLRGNRARSRAELLEEAKDAAIREAKEQRAAKPVSMAARERLWLKPIGRKVFEG